jgi:phage terminase large subunit-like protein
MNFELTWREMRTLAKASLEEKRRIIGDVTVTDALGWDVDFESWAHRNQLPPPDNGWRNWLMMAGRGFGKTRAGAEWIERLARSRPGVRIALIGATIDEARRVMVEGVSGVLSVAARNGSRVEWEPSIGRLTWRNGSEAQIFSGDNADGLRGPEHDFAWADELAKWRQADEAWTNLQFGLRRGSRPRVLVTTTPKSIGLLGRIRDDKLTVTTTGRTDENINLDEKFVEAMIATYGGTRIGRQEIEGELIEEIDGALWTREGIEKARATAPVCERIVVGVDPPAGVGDGVDACGIVVCGRRGDSLFVLDDCSVQGLSPEGWANRVAVAAARWGAARVVAEANNGGAMVKSVLLAADSGLRVNLVHARDRKAIRAEPVALKFEKGAAFLCGKFAELEAQMAGLVAGGGYEGPGRSPDRADAMVWAMTDLIETRSGVPRVRRL